MLIMSSCCECGITPPDSGCVDDFTDYNPDWVEADTPGGVSVAFTHNALNGYMGAGGDGSLTRTVAAPSMMISVKAVLINTGTTDSGVTIRRADSADNISLVRVWGTTDAYELRQGATVLQAFTAAHAAGDTIIKLEIVDAVSGTTDINCYVDGVLAHTEMGVAFTTPDKLNLGIICTGGGRWDWVEMTPCPVDLCDPYPLCNNIKTPAFYTFSTSGYTSPDGHVCEGSGLDFCAESLNGDFVLALPRYIVSAFIADWSIGGTSYEWQDSAVNNCIWGSVYKDGYEVCTYTGGGPPPADRLAVQNAPRRSSAGGDACTVCEPSSISYDASGFLDNWALEWEGGRLVLTGSGQISTSERVGVQYQSGLIDLGDPPQFPDSVVLNKISSTNPHECDGPATITLQANGLSREALRRLLGCDPICTPPLDPNKLYQLTTDDGTSNDVQACGSTSAIFNETTFSWEWTWVMVADYDPADTPPFGCVGDINFQAFLSCYERFEGEGKKWWLEFSGDVTGIIEWDVLNQDAVGLVNICGTPDVGFAALAQECVPEDHPLYDCIPEENKSLLCCLAGLIVREGDIGCEFGDPPGCTPFAVSLNYDEVSGHYIGDYPLSGFDVPADAKLHVWCNGGWNVALYHGTTHQTDLTFTDNGGGINLSVEWGADPYTCCGGAETGGFTIEGDFGG